MSQGFYRHYLKNIVKSPGIALREGFPELIKLAHQSGIPFHVFSAGLYDVIHEYISHLGLGNLNVHVVSNMMKFDPETDKLVGFQGALIHTFNKNGAALRGSPGWSTIAGRRSVLLLGDSLGDVNMSLGLESDTVINVAFLNDRVEERLPEFRKAFDVVLLGDAPVAFALELLQECLSSA